MSFKEHDILSFGLPGFLLLILTIVGTWIWQWPSEWDYNDIADFMAKLSAPLIFIIPLMAMITGWFVNGIAGLAMKIVIPRWPSFGINIPGNPLRSFKENKKISTREAYNLYKNKRIQINISDVDRFYYRYVLSRNMFWALVIFWIIMFMYSLLGKNSLITCVTPGILWCTAVISLLLAGLIMGRDLTTHIKFVFNAKKH